MEDNLAQLWINNPKIN